MGPRIADILEFNYWDGWRKGLLSGGFPADTANLRVLTRDANSQVFLIVRYSF